MLTNSRTLRIEWGDCDPAGIVFYPRYIAMFDHSTTMLITAASGLTKYELFRKYNFSGHPLIDTRVRFMSPSRFGDDITIESTFARIGRSSFEVIHRLLKDGALAVECFETRVWTAPDPNNPGRIKSEPIPAELVQCFKAK